MLTQETKRKIDSARNILVGKVPDPKAQVDQITTALIYKFMDDMDKEAIELGGKARFFTKGFEKYAWTKLLDQKLGGHERLELYGEAVAKMSQNPHIPQLFRDIFKDAFLPYRSPETLTLFLKEINGFTYDHSEDLGNAFEYLLSILGSQGDAGQFRTPRHIIDFIAEVVDPKKGDTILDPACGTAGFLISAYKNILKQQGDKPLTPDEKEKLMNNLVGYDISPDMVKLSKVNMYLHGFAEPKIFEYDTLSSDEKWDEMYDVIMANPPFMTPKGGIKPHKRFAIKSKRAEALFVDYIIEHLRTNGKAAVIVPDGIINNKSFTNLRKMIIDHGLYAVVSLHQYVFKPYAGAKTSILFFDKNINKKSHKIIFTEVENDGYQKGVQRLKINEDDLPKIVRMLSDFKNDYNSVSFEVNKYGVNSKVIDLDKLDNDIYFHYVEQITLFPNTYIYGNSVVNKIKKSIRIGDVFKIKKGTLQSTKATPGPYKFITASDDQQTHEDFTQDGEAIVIAVAAGGSLGKVQYVNEKFIASDLCFILTPKKAGKIDMQFALYYFKSIKLPLVKSLAKGVSKQSINKTDFANFLIDDIGLNEQKKVGDVIRDTNQKILEYQKKIQEAESVLINDIEKIRRN